MKKVIISIASIIMFSTLIITENKVSEVVPANKVTTDQFPFNSKKQTTVDFAILSNTE